MESDTTAEVEEVEITRALSADKSSPLSWGKGRGGKQSVKGTKRKTATATSPSPKKSSPKPSKKDKTTENEKKYPEDDDDEEEDDEEPPSAQLTPTQILDWVHALLI